MDVPEGEGLCAFIYATIGSLLGLIGGILWFPKLYIALPVTLGTGIVYALHSAVMLRYEWRNQRPVCKKATFFCLFFTCFLFAFALGGTIVTPQACSLSSYADWLWEKVNVCGVGIGGDIFLWAACIFWAAATYYAWKTYDETTSTSPVGKSWVDENTSTPTV